MSRFHSTALELATRIKAEARNRYPDPDQMLAAVNDLCDRLSSAVVADMGARTEEAPTAEENADGH